MRDNWYETIEKRYCGNINLNTIRHTRNGKGIAIYHEVYEHENFDISAKIIFNPVKNEQMKFPNKERHLYLDIEGSDKKLKRAQKRREQIPALFHKMYKFVHIR